MALRVPNYFEPREFARMRTRARRHSKTKHYETITKQLRDACEENAFIGISPQNLVEPAELLPIVMVREKFPKGRLRTFIDPRIIKSSGRRRVLDGCGNIRLSVFGKLVSVLTYVTRPTYLRFSHVLKDGTRKVENWREKLPRSSTAQSPLSILVHEIEHLKGRLLADHARERLIRLLRMRDYAVQIANQEVYISAVTRMPYVLVKEKQSYVLYHGGEFAPGTVPEVGPNALFGDHFLNRSGVKNVRVPYGGGLKKIGLSKFMKKILKPR